MTTASRPQSKTFHLTRAKKATIRLLTDYFCLTVKQAVILDGKDPQNKNHLRTVQRTFLLLWKEGYVHRIEYVEPGMDYATRSYVYGLSDKGVKEFGGKTFDDHSNRTLDHELSISDFHIALTQAFHEPRYKIKWHQSNIRRTVNPDAYFSITDYELPEKNNTTHYFLEIERAKIGNVRGGAPSIIRKLSHYYDYYRTDECKQEWGFKKYRVITVVRSSEKQVNLCRSLSEHYRDTMFWITSEDTATRNISGAIFSTPLDFTKAAYSFTNPNNPA